mmetsp:Transcript_20473/g.50198  ORF Transcript_20473/g.50198 Transcript_20473/m.50198 type:complete len:139 (+) Transcript_20473:1323-1739(+)
MVIVIIIIMITHHGIHVIVRATAIMAKRTRQLRRSLEQFSNLKSVLVDHQIVQPIEKKEGLCVLNLLVLHFVLHYILFYCRSYYCLLYSQFYAAVFNASAADVAKVNACLLQKKQCVFSTLRYCRSLSLLITATGKKF